MDIRGSRSPRASADGSMLAKLGIAALVLVVAAAVALGLGLALSGGGSGRPGATPSDGQTGGPTTGTSTTGTTAPGLDLTPLPAPDPVLSAGAAAPPVSLARLEAHLASALGAPSLGRHLAFGVAQLGRPKTHWAFGGREATPASTLKLLTTTAALAALGPDHRFATTVRAGPTPRSIVLVGGGDPLLTADVPTGATGTPSYPPPATLEDLANDTAAALLSQDVRQVRLGYDASLFAGPAVNPRWPADYVPDNVVSPISALWVDEGRETAGFAQRSADPPLAAAEEFRALLAKAGIKTVGSLDQRPSHGAALATAWSPTLQQIVQHTLEVSDNEAAEVLLRQVALADGHPGSFAAGVSAVRRELSGLGLSVGGATIYDGSGLSREDRVPVALLLDTIELVAEPTHPELRGVLTGLPVAGFSGSLADDFQDDAAAGLGYVRAKTGTLTGVHGLAGIAMTKAGQALAFVALADRVKPDTLQAAADLDAIAADLASCGC